VVNFGLRTGTQMFEAGKNFGKKLIKGKTLDMDSKPEQIGLPQLRWANLFEKLNSFTKEMGYVTFDLETLVLTEVLKSSEP
jgi:predicted hydrocarbon binding protein